MRHGSARVVRDPDTLADAVHALGRHRRRVATAWDLVLGECRAGLRRFVGTDHGDHYQQIIARLGEGDPSDPRPHERTLGDYLTPHRPGRMLELVNAVSRDLGTDAAGWGVHRLLSLAGMIDREGRQRERELR